MYLEQMIPELLILIQIMEIDLSVAIELDLFLEMIWM